MPLSNFFTLKQASNTLFSHALFEIIYSSHYSFVPVLEYFLVFSGQIFELQYFAHDQYLVYH